MRAFSTILKALICVLPWPLKRILLIRFYGFNLSKTARIGLSYIYPRHLEMAEGARIDHFNIAIHLDKMILGRNSYVGRSNRFTGHPVGGLHFKHRVQRMPVFLLGDESAVTKGHIFDCTDQIEIGNFATIAGYNSQFITHGINVKENRQNCSPISIGKFSMVGTGCVFLAGARIPSYSVVGAGAVVASEFDDKYALYAGVPAKRIKSLDAQFGYFVRKNGYVD